LPHTGGNSSNREGEMGWEQRDGQRTQEAFLVRYAYTWPLYLLDPRSLRLPWMNTCLTLLSYCNFFS
jgi:hypothetical protein